MGAQPRLRELEWDAVTGRFARRSTSQNPASEMWETSVCIPSSSIRATNSTPLADRPRSGSCAQEPHRALALFHTGFSSRTPHEAAVSRCAMSQSSRSAPSMLSSAAVLCWAAAAVHLFAPVRQRAIGCGLCSAAIARRKQLVHGCAQAVVQLAVPSGRARRVVEQGEKLGVAAHRRCSARIEVDVAARSPAGCSRLPRHSYSVSQCPGQTRRYSPRPVCHAAGDRVTVRVKEMQAFSSILTSKRILQILYARGSSVLMRRLVGVDLGDVEAGGAVQIRARRDSTAAVLPDALRCFCAGHILPREPHRQRLVRVLTSTKQRTLPVPRDEVDLTEAAVVAVRRELIAAAGAGNSADLCLAPRSLGAAHYCDLPLRSASAARHFFRANQLFRKLMRCSGQGPY